MFYPFYRSSIQHDGEWFAEADTENSGPPNQKSGNNGLMDESAHKGYMGSQ